MYGIIIDAKVNGRAFLRLNESDLVNSLKVSTGFKLLVLDVIDELVCTQSSISYIMVMIWIFYSVFSDQLPSSPSIHQQIKVVN